MTKIYKTERRLEMWERLERIYPERFVNALPELEQRMKKIVDLFSQKNYIEMKTVCGLTIPADEDGFTHFIDPTPGQITAHFDKVLAGYGVGQVDEYNAECTSALPDEWSESQVTQLRLTRGSTDRDSNMIYTRYMLTTDGRLNGLELSGYFSFDENDKLVTGAFSLENDVDQKWMPFVI